MRGAGGTGKGVGPIRSPDVGLRLCRCHESDLMEIDSTDPLEGITPVSVSARLDSRRPGHIIAVIAMGGPPLARPVSGEPFSQQDADRALRA